MKYRARHNVKVRCGRKFFTVLEGKEVTVAVKDEVKKRVLIVFGSRLVDWFSEQYLDDNFVVIGACSGG